MDAVQLGLAGGAGRPLPQALRGQMEAALGADFSAVRVHVGPQASRLGAIAFTTGSDIYFAPGGYQPETHRGQELLGYELAHVVQQRQGRVRNTSGAPLAVVLDRALESEADRMGRRALLHRATAQARMAPGTAEPSAAVQPMFGWLMGQAGKVKDAVTGRTPVSEEMQSKLDCAQGAIDYARPFITHGPQNQEWARDEFGDEGDVNMGAMITLVNQQWNGSGGYATNWVRPRRIGAAVAATGGGNCQDIAALAYNYLREHAMAHWTICFVVAQNTHHAFATIGNPLKNVATSVAVADAWVRYPMACRLSEHFCRNYGSINVLPSEVGVKPGRTAGLMSKYWDTNTLPGYVTGLKTTVRGNPRNPATWNHAYAIDTWVTPNYVVENKGGAILPI